MKNRKLRFSGIGSALLAIAVPFVVHGCAIGPEGTDDIGVKAEPVLGARCTRDAQCAAAEYCAIPVSRTEGVCEVRYDFSETTSTSIPDNSALGTSRQFTVVNPGATVGSVRLTAFIRHPYRGDLRVVLRSPSGTEAVLQNRTGASADDLTLDVPVTQFTGERAHGTWTLAVSDLAASDVGTLVRWRLVFAYGAPDVGPEEDVWTTVSVTGIQSAHNYANNANQTFPLSSFTGGGSRARIHFTRMDLEEDYDFVEVLDGSGAVLDSYTGAKDDFTTGAFETANLTLRLTSDSSINDWGFLVDSIEVYGAGCLADDDCGPGRHCPTTRVCVRYPCFQTCEPLASGGEEGDACDSTSDCNEALYCRAGACRADGSCRDPEDCGEGGNEWAHPLCVGTPECSDGECSWTCGRPPSRVGEACDATADCVVGLYCSSDGTCHARGTCDDTSDCNRTDNTYSHTTCTTGTGVGECSARGVCGWTCPPADECRAGETRTLDCNTCSCADGRWRCTTRVCPVVADLGEACGGSSRIGCDTGLVCDRSGAGSCGALDRGGVCVEAIDSAPSCGSSFSPVCGCNGQTFANECLRVGLSDFASRGRCELSMSIPDNDPTGVTLTMDVRGAPGLHLAQVAVEIEHAYRADLIVLLTAPSGRRFTLHNRGGAGERNFTFSSELNLGSASATGTWTLFVSDNDDRDLGRIKFFNVTPR